MKFSKEIKIALVTIVAILIIYFGIMFLKNIKMSRNMARLIRLPMALASWKSATKSSCSIVAKKTVASKNSSTRTLTSALVSSASRPLPWIPMTSSRFRF